MKYFCIILACFICNNVGSTSAFGWEEPIATTQQTIARWFEKGIKQEATHLIVVCDRFSYDEFPDYIYLGEIPEERVNYWNSQALFNVMEVYALHLDMTTQLDEYRSWHFETSFE